jgi:hypothetical protein
MKLYVAGPMRGKPKFNFTKFDEVCARIRKAGHVAIGPQELDRLCGLDENTMRDGDVTPQMIRNFMRRDTLMILDEAEGVCVLDGWELSSGARAEVALALMLRLPVFDEYLRRIFITTEIRSSIYEHI